MRPAAAHDVPDRPPLPPIIAFAAVMFVAVAAAVLTRNWEFVFHAVAATAVAGVVLWVRRSLFVSNGVLWALVACAAAHMAGGLIPVPATWPTTPDANPGPEVLYDLWLLPRFVRYDHALHAAGFGTAAVGLWQVLRGLAPSLRPTVGPMLFCWIAAMGCGALNEVAEFAAVVFLERTNVGDFRNAMLDLVANAVGAGVAVTGLAWASRLRRRAVGRASPHRRAGGWCAEAHPTG